MLYHDKSALLNQNNERYIIKKNVQASTLKINNAYTILVQELNLGKISSGLSKIENLLFLSKVCAQLHIFVQYCRL